MEGAGTGCGGDWGRVGWWFQEVQRGGRREGKKALEEVEAAWRELDQRGGGGSVPGGRGTEEEGKKPLEEGGVPVGGSGRQRRGRRTNMATRQTA